MGRETFQILKRREGMHRLRKSELITTKTKFRKMKTVNHMSEETTM